MFVFETVTCMSHICYMSVTDELLVCFLLYLTDAVHTVALTALHIVVTYL